MTRQMKKGEQQETKWQVERETRFELATLSLEG